MAMTGLIPIFDYVHGLVGRVANVVPDHAAAVVMFRLVSSSSSIFDDLQVALQHHENVTARVLSANDPLEMYAPPVAAAAYGTYVASYNTDLSYFQSSGNKVLFGGGSISTAHSDNEYIDLGALEQMPLQYQSIVHELLDDEDSENVPDGKTEL